MEKRDKEEEGGGERRVRTLSGIGEGEKDVQSLSIYS